MRLTKPFCVGAALLLLAGCGQDSGGAAAPGHGSGGSGGSSGGGHSTGGDDVVTPPTGTTDFVSADTQHQGGPSKGAAVTAAGSGGSTATAPAAGAADTSSRTVERGDVYKVLADHRILNLNSYRGVQVIDVSNVDAPRVEGRLAVAGEPVEMYVVGDRAIVLLNNWQGYYGSRSDVKVDTVQGGLVMNVDISDRAHPVLLDQFAVPGYIQTSRLTEGGGTAALYVAASSYNQTTSTVVKSFDVSGKKLVPKSELDLGGYVQDVQATDADILLVASQDYQTNQYSSQVSVIDISSPDGTMVQGGSVVAQGMVQNKFQMDAYNGVLRVVSGSTWNGIQNHLETFSLKDLKHPTKIADCPFGTAPSGQNESLYATVFLENRAFFVTYWRKDPFHAFSVGDDGKCQEHSAFVVSGWNDFLRPTLNETRLLGVGKNDENSTSKLSVSLYDATNLDNQNPLLGRADIDLTYGYSQAQWDDRGFSVIEDAVSARATDGTVEKGLLLLPFEGWDSGSQNYVADVQLFTFSDHTLTRRGVMNHGTPVKRSFLADQSIAANLSEEEISLFDTTNTDAPKERGRADVAPDYSHLLVFGDYVARVKDRSYYFSSSGTNTPDSEVQILRRSADLDLDAPIATFKVPAGADLLQVGNLLVSVNMVYPTNSTNTSTPVYHTTIQVYDLSNPQKPAARGSLETDRLSPSYGGYYYGTPAIDCFGRCWGGGGYGYGQSGGNVVGQAIAFTAYTSHQVSLGTVQECYEYAPGVACIPPVGAGGDTSASCPKQSYAGQRNCRTPAGGKETCTGSFYSCDSTTGSCTQVADTPPGVQRNCYTTEEFRYWQSYSFDVLDLRNADKPALAARVDLPSDEEGTSVLADGTSLFVNHQKPYSVTDDPRAYVKHYFRELDVADPSHAKVGDAVNVPGDVIARSGTTVYARDLVYQQFDTRTLVSRLTVDGGLAHLQASHLFQDRAVSAVELDGAGHMLVSSDPGYSAYYYFPVTNTNTQQPQHKLSILDEKSLATAGEADVDQWATFKAARGGRALFQVSGGLLVFDVSDAAHPAAQAYFPTLGWPDDVYFDGKEIIFAAGPYGIYRFDASTFNLLSK